jgi:curli biogenesis system outer membrane secretion channel CsgG
MSVTFLRLAAITLAIGTVVALASCGGESRESAEADTLTANVGKYPPPPTGAWQPRVGIPPFTTKGVSAGSEIGEQAADELTTLAMQAERFKVIERAQLDQLLNEQGLAGVVKGKEMAQPGQVRGVDYLIYGKVTNFRVKAEKSGGGFGLANINLPGGGSLGAFDFKNKKSKITVECGVDLRMVDPSTGEIAAANFSEYKRTDAISGFGIEILGANAEADADLQIDHDNQGKILRLALDEALRKMLPKVDNVLKQGPPAKPEGEAAPASAKPAPKVGAKPAAGPNEGAKPEAMTADKPEEDTHWIQPDDYFTSDRDLEGAYIYVQLGKMIEPPNEKTKEEAQFMNLKDGSSFWTKHYWKTRLATKDDIKPATLVIVFEGNRDDGVYKAPASKDDARTGNWFLGRITDISDLYKNMIKVGTYNVNPAALRVVAK